MNTRSDFPSASQPQNAANEVSDVIKGVRRELTRLSTDLFTAITAIESPMNEVCPQHVATLIDLQARMDEFCIYLTHQYIENNTPIADNVVRMKDFRRRMPKGPFGGAS